MRCEVELEGVSLHVGGREIVSGVSAIFRGPLVAIMGPNGAGKTTLLKLIAGTLRPSAGRLRVCGSESASGQLSYVPPYLQTDPYAKVEDIVEAYMYGKKLSRHALQRIPFRGRRFSELSAGEHKQVLIEAALARDPRILLLDEPFSHLDIANQGKLARRLRAVAEGGVLVIMTVHEPIFATIADELALMSRGRLVAVGSPQDILRKDLVEKVYGAEVEEIEGGGRKILLPLLPSGNR